MGNSLYVYGGVTSDGGMMLPIERLTNVNCAMDDPSVSWETIRIDAEITCSPFMSMMVPQNDSEKILILRRSG